MSTRPCAFTACANSGWLHAAPAQEEHGTAGRWLCACHTRLPNPASACALPSEASRRAELRSLEGVACTLLSPLSPQEVPCTLEMGPYGRVEQPTCPAGAWRWQADRSACHAPGVDVLVTCGYTRTATPGACNTRCMACTLLGWRLLHVSAVPPCPTGSSPACKIPRAQQHAH